MRYHICREKRLSDLAQQVQGYLNEGWEAQGGIAVDSGLDGLYYQAIINRDLPAAPKKNAQAHN